MRENSPFVTASEKKGAGCSLFRVLFPCYPWNMTQPNDKLNADAEARLLAEVKSACELHPNMQITVDMAANDDLARKHGWSDAKAMREGVRRVLQTLPADIAKRIV